MNVVEQMEIDDLAGTSLAEPQNYQAYREMIVPSSPSWVEEHVRRLSAAGIQSAFQFYNINSYETVERLIRRGVYKGPLVMNWVAIGGGMDQPTIYSLSNFLRAIPDGSMLTVESSMRNVLPDQHDGHRHGLARALRHRGQSLEPVAHGQDDHRAADRAARAHLPRVRPRRGQRQGSARDLQDRRVLRHVEETLAANGFAPNAKGRQQGFLRKVA
jgi:hypothetical protein